MSETPRKLGRYELIRRIAVGGMGEIYLARTRGTAGFEKTVIIKTILPHLAEEEEFVEKFLDEGRIVVNLTHGNIVPVFDMDEADGEYFIAMEYVPGRDVRDVLASLRDRGETMPSDLAAYIVSEVCEGLGYAHRKTDDQGNPLDIVHRDVSPSNVLISTDGEVKIIDFGVARAADRRAKTVTGRIQGKCCYMSPEQARGESLDHRSDVFSTGVVFYEMLTNVRPFEGDSDLKSLDLVRECEFDPPSVLEPTVPEELDEVVGRALAEDPDERYDRIDEMKVDLMEYLVSRGRAVTSEEVADFLTDLFPEGLEREEFREVREEADEPSGPMEIDDALEYQLDQLDGDAEGVDPLDETLPEREGGAQKVGDMGRTETITPESGLRDGGEEDDETAASETQQPTAPDRPEAKRRAREDEDPDAETDEGRPGETEQVGDDSTSWGWIAASAGVLLVAAVSGLVAFGGTSKGTLEVETNPPGALLRLDGSKLTGRKTPAELRLPIGEHTLTLTKEGYRTKRRDFRLTEEQPNRSLVLELVPDGSDEQPKPREFELRTKPPGARLWANQRELGRAPQRLEVAPGETKFLEANKEGCDRARMPVYYGRKEQTIRIELDCPRLGADAGADQGRTAAAGASTSPGTSSGAPTRRRRRAEVEFRSKPAGASVRIDGEKLGRTPVEGTWKRGTELSVRFEKSGHQPAERSVEVGALEGGTLRVELEERRKGCLDFFAVYPEYNEIAIDGEWLDGRRRQLQDYRLAPGEHEIRVRNPEAGKDETFTFEVDPGDECTFLKIWDPDDG